MRNKKLILLMPLRSVLFILVFVVASAGQILATSVIPGFYEMMLAHA